MKTVTRMATKGWIKRAFGAVADMAFPRVCAMCGRTLIDGEEVLCLHCVSTLPVTDMHLTTPSRLEERLLGSVPLERAVAYCHYDRGAPYALLVQYAKYNSRPGILRWLARRYAATLQASGFFDDIDVIMPVPMYLLKKMRRGYNQAEWVARGVSDVTGLPVVNNLVAVRGHDTQTHRSGYARWENAQSLYRVERPGEVDGKHVLLVDDVITTGATILACGACVHQASPTARLSAFAVASARLS